MGFVKRYLDNNSLIGNAMKLASSNFLMFLIPVVVTPVLSRIYTPEDFGDWGVFSGAFTIISVVLFLCYEYAIVRSDHKELPNICLLCLMIAAGIILSIYGIFELGKYLGIGFFITFPYPTYFFAYLTITAFLIVFQNMANKAERYWVMSVGCIISGLSQAILRILFANIVFFSNGLIAGTVAAQLLNSIFYLFLIISITDKRFFGNISLARIADGFKRYRKFPLYDAPATLLAFAAFNLPILILSSSYSKSEIGCYSVIIQLLLLPMSLIGSAIGKVYYQQISKSDAGKETIGRVSFQVLRIVSVISVLPMLLLVLGGDKLITLFLGERWVTAGNIALCLSIWSVPTILTQPLLPIYRRLDRQNNMLIYNALYFVLGIGTLIVSCYMGLDLYAALLVYAASCSIAKTAMFVNICKLCGIRIRDAYTRWSFALLCTCIALLVVRIIFLLVIV